MEETKKRAPTGFLLMSPERHREIARKGGRAAHEKGVAHEWSQDEARAAGQKGGQISRGGRGRLLVAPQEEQPVEPPASEPDTAA